MATKLWRAHSGCTLTQPAHLNQALETNSLGNFQHEAQVLVGQHRRDQQHRISAIPGRQNIHGSEHHPGT